MKTLAYIRQYKNVSISEQLKSLKDFRCDEIFIEEQLSIERVELQRLQMMMQNNDRVIIKNIKVFNLEANASLELLGHFASREIEFISLDEEFSSKKNPSFAQIFLGLAEMDKSYKIKEKHMTNQKSENRTKEIIKYNEIGRPSIDYEKIHTIRFLYKSKSLSMREIATKCNVSLGTVHKYLNNNE